jgi:glycosyltransferase involved in cell wall biosynthesis
MDTRDTHIDVSVRAATELSHAIRKEKNGATAPRISVEQAVSEPRVVQATYKRTSTRVLFISKDDSFLNPETQTLDGFLDLKHLFEEVHIVILRQGIPAKNPVLRVADNVWIYTASSRWWFLVPRAGIKTIEEQLVFAAGFRPDLVVARDPFESAMVAQAIAKQYERPTQVHILEDYATAEFDKRNKHAWWLRRLANRMIPKFPSIRVTSSAVEQILAKRYTIPDISLLPRYHDYESIINAEPSLDLRETYKPFVFIILCIGKLSHTSTLFRAIDAARFVLKNPRVGMIVLGDGQAKSEFQRRAKALGIERQVVFDSKTEDSIPHLKSANLLIATDTDEDSDAVILKAAAAGLPIIMSRTEKREDLFEHGVSGYLCEATDTQAFADRINDVLNNFGLRKVFADNAQMMIHDKFHQDIHQYAEAYRTSIEQALFVDDETHDSSV